MTVPMGPNPIASWITDENIKRMIHWAQRRRRDIRLTLQQWNAVKLHIGEKPPTLFEDPLVRALNLLLGPRVVLCEYLYESTPVVMGLMEYLGYPEPPSKTIIDELCQDNADVQALRATTERAAEMLLIPRGTEEWYGFLLNVVQYEMWKENDRERPVVGEECS